MLNIIGLLVETRLPSAGLLISTVLLVGSLTPVRMIGRERSGGDVSTVLSVITIYGGSPSPVYPSTAALLTCTGLLQLILKYLWYKHIIGVS